MSVLGNSDTANFIFFSIPRGHALPTKDEFSNAFENHQMKIYKAYGYFRYELKVINTALFILKNNVREFTDICGYVDEFNFVARLSSTCKANSFFNIQHPEIVKQYRLDRAAIESIVKIIEAIRFIKEMNEDFKNWKYVFERGKRINHELMLADPKMGNPNKAYISSLFDDYGTVALDQLYQQIIDWDKKVTWL
ncbi:hypothetical protein [Polynucleobacter acidiphobus]|uniref:hypothetical protein n=1 Tax=Polynucleobacter acidiphobus TaxID=556053 RepID=UPI000D35CBF1|nr:hypothetical protein [Polynucleobacter acidiphobus]